MSKTLIADWLISLPHAIAIIKTMGQKSNREGEWDFELEELGITFNQLNTTHTSDLGRRAFYATYTSESSLAYRMKIWRGKTTSDLQRE